MKEECPPKDKMDTAKVHHLVEHIVFKMDSFRESYVSQIREAIDLDEECLYEINYPPEIIGVLLDMLLLPDLTFKERVVIAKLLKKNISTQPKKAKGRPSTQTTVITSNDFCKFVFDNEKSKYEKIKKYIHECEKEYGKNKGKTMAWSFFGEAMNKDPTTIRRWYERYTKYINNK